MSSDYLLGDSRQIVIVAFYIPKKNCHLMNRVFGKVNLANHDSLNLHSTIILPEQNVFEKIKFNAMKHLCKLSY